MKMYDDRVPDIRRKKNNFGAAYKGTKILKGRNTTLFKF
jgi:hypothetical protein